jgi:hypothetical protein
MDPSESTQKRYVLKKLKGNYNLIELIINGFFYFNEMIKYSKVNKKFKFLIEKNKKFEETKLFFKDKKNKDIDNWNFFAEKTLEQLLKYFSQRTEAKPYQNNIISEYINFRLKRPVITDIKYHEKIWEYLKDPIFQSKFSFTLSNPFPHLKLFIKCLNDYSFLKELHIWNNSDSFSDFSEKLAENKYIKSLTLSQFKFQDDNEENVKIFYSLHKNKFLEYLKLYHISWTEHNCELFLESLALNSRLKGLEIKFSALLHIENIPKILLSNKLEYLTLSSCSIDNQQLSLISQFLKDSTINTLCLEGNKFNNIKDLMFSIMDNQNIKYLCIQNNKLSFGIEALGEFLIKNLSLLSLNLGECRISKTEIKYFVDALMKEKDWQKLKINIRGNRFGFHEMERMKKRPFTDKITLLHKQLFCHDTY